MYRNSPVINTDDTSRKKYWNTITRTWAVINTGDTRNYSKKYYEREIVLLSIQVILETIVKITMKVK